MAAAITKKEILKEGYKLRTSVWYHSRASDRLYARKMELVFTEIRVAFRARGDPL